MELKIDAPNIDSSSALRVHVEENLGAALDKYFGQSVSAHVHFRKTNLGFVAALGAHINKHLELRAEAEAGDAYSAFDLALNKLEKRLRRNKRRIRDDHNKKTDEERFVAAQESVFAAPEEVKEDAEPEDWAATIVAEMAVELSSLSVADAVTRLDLTDRPVLLFKNAANGRFSLVYRRQDGNVGWVEPKVEGA